MKLKVLIFTVMVTFLLAGCSQIDFSNDETFGQDETEQNLSGDVSEVVGTGENTVVYAGKDRIQLNWARAEIIRTEGDTGYAAIFGILRVEKGDGREQKIIVKYYDGRQWLQTRAANKGYTNGGAYRKYYFHTPEFPVDLTAPKGKEMKFKLKYYYGDTILWAVNKDKQGFKVNCLPGMYQPRSLLGANHILVEDAVLTPVRDEQNVLTHYKFNASVQVKNDDVEFVRFNYVANSTEWNWGSAYGNGYANSYLTNSGEMYKNFAYVSTLGKWTTECILPADTQYFQFVFFKKLTNGSMFADKNRCRRYWITADPEKPVSLEFYTTN